MKENEKNEIEMMEQQQQEQEGVFAININCTHLLLIHFNSETVALITKK
jgi:hypothetical protein